MEIGSYAFIGAGAVVTKDVKPYALVVGNPARQIGWMCACGNRLSLKDHSQVDCEHCDLSYLIIDGECKQSATGES